MIQLGHHADLPRGRLSPLAELVITVARSVLLLAVDLRVTVVGVIVAVRLRRRPGRCAPTLARRPRAGGAAAPAASRAEAARPRSGASARPTQLVVTAGQLAGTRSRSASADHHRPRRGLHPGDHRRLRLDPARPAGAPGRPVVRRGPRLDQRHLPRPQQGHRTDPRPARRADPHRQDLLSSCGQ